MDKKKILTRSEFKVMHILWTLPTKGAFTSDILAKYEAPKPAYTTLATFLKILANKGFVKVLKVGSMLYYVPIVTLEEYTETTLGNAKDVYFNGSFTSLIHFFAKRESLSEEELNEAISILQAQKK